MEELKEVMEEQPTTTPAAGSSRTSRSSRIRTASHGTASHGTASHGTASV